jgi:peroxiredoxin
MNASHDPVRQDPYVLPDHLPVPVDDGAAEHLLGMTIPPVVLPSTMGDVSLAEIAKGRLVLYAFPRTRRPDRPSDPGWDEVPGARGCTPQSVAFRDHVAELGRFGARVVGVSVQPLVEQIEFAVRTSMPFPIISDERFVLADVLRLPTFEFDGRRFYKRLTLVTERGVIVRVFYPVFPPDRNAVEVLDWFTERQV